MHEIYDLPGNVCQGKRNPPETRNLCAAEQTAGRARPKFLQCPVSLDSFVSSRRTRRVHCSCRQISRLFPIFRDEWRYCIGGSTRRMQHTKSSARVFLGLFFLLFPLSPGCGRLSRQPLFLYFSAKRGRIIELHARTADVIAKMSGFRREQWKTREIATEWKNEDGYPSLASVLRSLATLYLSIA